MGASPRQGDHRNILVGASQTYLVVALYALGQPGPPAVLPVALAGVQRAKRWHQKLPGQLAVYFGLNPRTTLQVLTYRRSR